MKISPYSAVTFALMTGAIFVTSCTNDIEVDKNIDPAGNAISFAPSVGHTSRATETDRENLGDFAVVARGMHHDGVLYDNYLIGSANGGEIAKRVEGSQDTWKLDRSVYWPATLNKVLFFAYTALKADDAYDGAKVLGTNATDPQPAFGFNGDNPYINNFKPLKATAVESNIQADGKNQKDLLVAFTEQKKTQSETNVSLKFEHALTQVSIEASQEGKLDTDNRIVKVKGAWIVNAAASGNLTTTGDKDDDNMYTYTKSWTVSGKTAYGSVWSDVVQLGSTSTDILREHSLMLIPENLTGWNLKDKNDNNNNGAYIMLLCRVELEHEGTTHSGSNLEDIYVDAQKGKHYHQLFPVNVNTYDAAEYGFVCVPLSSTWNSEGIGKHYTYNLNICGNGTGAGKYPPTMAETDVKNYVPETFTLGETPLIKVVLNNPDITGKNAGDNVLDEPIQFTVTVDGWTKPENWTPGNGTF